MATIVKTPSGTWKAVIRKAGYPTNIKTFRLKKDAEDWARRTEDEMVRGMFVQRSPSERLTFENRFIRMKRRAACAATAQAKLSGAVRKPCCAMLGERAAAVKPAPPAGWQALWRACGVAPDRRSGAAAADGGTEPRAELGPRGWAELAAGVECVQA